MNVAQANTLAEQAQSVRPRRTRRLRLAVRNRHTVDQGGVGGRGARQGVAETGVLAPPVPAAAASSRFTRTAQQRRQLLDAAFSDNSREIQARFLATHGAATGPLSDRGQLAAMVRNLSAMVTNQIHQYTGDEPYRRADYRLFLDTFDSMRNPPAAEQDPWRQAARGTFLDRLMGRASQIFGILNPGPSLGLDTVG